MCGPFAGVVLFDELDLGAGGGVSVEEFETLVDTELAVGLEEEAAEAWGAGFFAEEESLDFAAGVGAPGAEARAQDEGVVDGEGVVGADVLGEIADGAVLDVCGGLAADDEEAGVLAALGGSRGDEFWGEGVVEFVGAHVAWGACGCGVGATARCGRLWAGGCLGECELMLSARGAWPGVCWEGGMESAWHEMAMRRDCAVPVTPRFSVYLQREALERARETLELASPSEAARRDADVYEPSAGVERSEGTERARRVTDVREVTRVRVQMTSPAGRFLDLLI